ncbi:MAG: hypothetical protein A3B37_02630 [Candidatus Sungbacteria bacterium RIFCSPLOWO2_01_FULL_59_16]|uniref:Photosynthesis system II assembly factor Ycf48/Hcf136-like domain-containing protein n=1 Tax=Candidatus Sungbacteria bacterium RIFCSPLOWO2_01_FULL_59_16 TaxID=1802280 RepID=A0A1G2LAQ9_9BACT|nr:MAG: hypothetical protein A3B37_02630 [Candidatus Sungbacteria bacterium RIFCSPLOWO2_01_FULL_59_16]
MNTKTVLVVFFAIFTVGLALIVLLPFFLARRPAEPEPEARGAAAPAVEGVFRSDDGGRSWQARSAIAGGGSVAGLRVNRLVLDPADPATLYLLTDGGGLFVTRDRAETWERVNDTSGLLEPDANVLALAVNPARREEWYVAVFRDRRGRVFRTDDGGRVLREIYFTPLERFGVFDVHVERGGRTVWIATGQGGILESRDRGRTWRVVRWFADGLVRLLVNPARPAVRFAAGAKGSLFRSPDGGVTWYDVTAAYRNFSGALQNQRWFTDRSGAVWLGSNHGLLRSGDDAETFEAPPLIIPPDALPVLALAVDPRDTSRIVVAADGQLYASEDGGKTWAILPSPAPSGKRVTHLLFDAERAETIYAVVQL